MRTLNFQRGAKAMLASLSFKMWLISTIPAFVWLLTFWPGIMVLDSYIQWDQMTGAVSLTDWHPAFHTLLMRLLTKIHFSPTSIAVVQILIFALTINFGLKLFHGRGLPARWMLAIALVFFLNPFVSQFSITVIKDSLYSIGIVALSFWAFYFLQYDLPTKKYRHFLIFLAFSLTLLITATVRHNGVPVVYLFSFVFAFIIPSRARKIVYLSLVAFFVSSILIKDVYYNQIMSVSARAERTKLKGLSFMPQIALQLQAGHVFSDEENKIIDQIMPQRSSWFITQLAGNSTALWVSAGKGCDLFIDEGFTKTVMALSAKAFFSNPLPVLKFTFWNNETLWNPLRHNDTLFIHNYNAKVVTNYDDLETKSTRYHPEIARNSQLPDLVTPLATLYWMFTGNINNPSILSYTFQILSSVAFHFYLFFILGIVAYIRLRKKSLLMPMLLVGTHLAFLIPLINADFYTYYLCLQFMSFVWSPIYLYMILSTKYKSIKPLSL